MEKYIVTFYPDNKKVTVDAGTTLMSAAISAKIPLNSVCGGDGVCGRCRVIIRSGDKHSKGVCLACQTIVKSNLEIEIPMESRLDLAALSPEELNKRLRGVFSKAEEISEAKPLLGEGVFNHRPLVTKLYIELPKPDFNDKLSDLERVCRAVGEKIGNKPVDTGLSNIRRLGQLLRSCDWKITVSLANIACIAEIVTIEPGDKTGNNLGFAFDIGTTTITTQLVDLKNKKVVGTKAIYNRQATFGSDVITRIIYAQDLGGLEKLHLTVVDSLNEMIELFVCEHKVDLNNVLSVSVSGNTTMMHLLLKVDPTHIRQEPYVPTANVWPVFKAADAGIKINPHGLLFCMPGVASYVGADITAGILACDMHKSDEVNLLIDIGTNGEIALGNSQWLIGCAASAGPAFEGSGMTAGLRAVNGAIQSVDIDGQSLDVKFKTIGNDKPRGICGSGYIEIAAQLLKLGVLGKNGKLNQEIKNKRLRLGENGCEFIVVFANDSSTGSDIVITDTDLDNLKRAKAAIYSGMSILARHMDMVMGDINKIFIAGGFGTALNIENAVQIGLIPDLPREKFVFVGNSSLSGARQNLLSCEAKEAAEKLAANVTYFELSTDPIYMDEYMAALFFPHTDVSRFPTVKYC